MKKSLKGSSELSFVLFRFVMTFTFAPNGFQKTGESIEIIPYKHTALNYVIKIINIANISFQANKNIYVYYVNMKLIVFMWFIDRYIFHFKGATKGAIPDFR